MLTTLTFVKMKPGLDRDAFYTRWQEHTRDFDLRDHPEISLNRLMMFDEGWEFVGVCENHWPDRATLEAAIKWYETPKGQEHQADLDSFMDSAGCRTLIVSDEADVSSEKGIVRKTGAGTAK